MTAYIYSSFDVCGVYIHHLMFVVSRFDVGFQFGVSGLKIV